MPSTFDFISIACYLVKHGDFKLRLGELLPVSVAFSTNHTALGAGCPGNSGTTQEVPSTKLKLESHSLSMEAEWQTASSDVRSPHPHIANEHPHSLLARRAQCSEREFSKNAKKLIYVEKKEGRGPFKVIKVSRGFVCLIHHDFVVGLSHKSLKMCSSPL